MESGSWIKGPASQGCSQQRSLVILQLVDDGIPNFRWKTRRVTGLWHPKEHVREIATKIKNGLQRAMEVGLANDLVLDEMTVRLRDQQASLPL